MNCVYQDKVEALDTKGRAYKSEVYLAFTDLENGEYKLELQKLAELLHTDVNERAIANQIASRIIPASNQCSGAPGDAL